MSETIHLVKDGDTFFGLRSVQCGIKVYDGMQAHLSASMVTCGVCKRTNEYKRLMEEERKDREYPLIDVNKTYDYHAWADELQGAKVVGVMEQGTGVTKVIALKLEKDKKFYWIDLKQKEN